MSYCRAERRTGYVFRAFHLQGKENSKTSKATLPLLSIVVLNWNGKRYLKECLSSLQNLTYPNYEVILTDNTSSDGSADFVHEYFSWVKVLSLDKNYGFAEGNNRGASIARGKYIAFLNNDTEVDRDWLNQLVNSVEIRQDVAAVSSKMLFFDNRSKINYAGAKFIFVGMGYEVRYGQHDDDRFDHIEITGAPCGGAMLIDR